MVTTSVQVMSQTTGPDGLQSCGYHTFKNSILTLLLWQKIISEEQFHSMLNNPQLFADILKATKKIRDNGSIDLSAPLFFDVLKSVKAGELDLSAHGITRENLSSLNLDFNGTQDISVSSCILYPSAPGHGLEGAEDDLFAAAMAAKLARTKGEFNHVFAVGLSDPLSGIGHWVTAAVRQDANGQRTWQVMDSWNNQTRYRNTVVMKVESVLKMKEPSLQAYLIEAYDAASDLLNRRYTTFAILPAKGRSPKWGLKEDETRNALEFFITDKKNLADFTIYIKNRFIFMQTAEWLSGGNTEEKARVTQLYDLTKFIFEHAEKNDIEARTDLKTICLQLQKGLGIEEELVNHYDKYIATGEICDSLVFVNDQIFATDAPALNNSAGSSASGSANAPTVSGSANVPTVSGSANDPAVSGSANDPAVSGSSNDATNDFVMVESSSELNSETLAALQAVKEGQPKPTEGFYARAVNAIAALWEGIKSAFSYVARSIGIIS